MAIGGAWSRLVDDHGWRQGLDVARLLGMWSEIVGAANAEHATPESFDPESGVLLIRTSSTAWAEQLRLMMPTLRTAIEAQVGPGVVRDIKVVGPTPPRTRGTVARARPRAPRHLRLTGRHARPGIAESPPNASVRRHVGGIVPGRCKRPVRVLCGFPAVRWPRTG